MASCRSTSALDQKVRSYRDPITYSFEAHSPYTEEDPLLKLLNKAKETSRQIKEWEKKHLW